ncbi:MAG: cyclic pyranopterin monophosphate synthase MoaC [Pseudomonadota bacterium]
MMKKDNSDLTHFNHDGAPRMVDVTDKPITARLAVARGFVLVGPEAMAVLEDKENAKGDPIVTSELAGIMGAKQTSRLIPLCHPLPIDGVDIETHIDTQHNRICFIASVKTSGRTGVEMEALIAVSIACLTFYDMLKAVDKKMTISSIELLEKSGGASGDFKRDSRQ